MTVNDNTFLVVAGSSGIGRQVVAQLKEAGAKVAATSREEAKLDDINADVKLSLEATNFDAVDEAFQTAQDKIGPLAGVVNCAGSLLLKSAHQTKKSEYEETIAASLTTAFAVTAAAGKQMKNGGSVVLISSAAAMEGLANHEAIAAAKGGIIGLARSAAATYASQNLRFNVVAPGMTETPLTEAMLGNDMARKVSTAMHALGRVGTPDHIAQAVTFFLDPANDWITGQVLGVDGGLSRVRPKMKV